MTDDVRTAVVAAENALRELVEMVLSNSAGSDWLRASGLPPVRVQAAEERRIEERSRRSPLVVPDRLVEYLQLSDLRTIIVDKQWPQFAAVLGNKARFQADMDRLERSRDPQMHGRGLVPYEVHLALGISGDIRTRVATFRSEKTKTEEYFPRIERVTDSFGQVATGHSTSYRVPSGKLLRPGDLIDYQCEGWDPAGEELDWAWLLLKDSEIRPIEGSTFTWAVNELDIGEVDLRVYIRSRRNYHLKPHMDDFADFRYLVVPRTRPGRDAP